MVISLTREVQMPKPKPARDRCGKSGRRSSRVRLASIKYLLSVVAVILNIQPQPFFHKRDCDEKIIE